MSTITVKQTLLEFNEVAKVICVNSMFLGNCAALGTLAGVGISKTLGRVPPSVPVLQTGGIAVVVGTLMMAAGMTGICLVHKKINGSYPSLYLG